MFFLKDTALHWFENHEKEITSWENFVSAVQGTFGQTDVRRQQAHGRLANRTQTATESLTAYIQDVLCFCAWLDPNMPEADKVGNLFKGITEDLFSVIASKAASTVKDLIAHAKQYGEFLDQRILRTFSQWFREHYLPNLIGPTTAAYIRTDVR